MEYEIIYSDRKTVSICVKDGNLIIRAPHGTKESKIEKLISSHITWINKHINSQKEKKAREISLTDEEISRLKRFAKEILTAKCEYYSKLMGVKYNRITVTSAKKRFGSCSSKGNIAFSYRLMLYPECAVDYVVVHELAHLLEMNHSGRFYKIIEGVLPDYKERRKMLLS